MPPADAGAAVVVVVDVEVGVVEVEGAAVLLVAPVLDDVGAVEAPPEATGSRLGSEPRRAAMAPPVPVASAPAATARNRRRSSGRRTE